MGYITHGHLRKYLEVERSEREAKVITWQPLEGLVVIHQEGFAHRDLKPEVRPPRHPGPSAQLTRAIEHLCASGLRVSCMG